MQDALCSCVDVDFGNYDATVSMKTATGKWVGIDVCIATEIGRLWINGVTTLNSCCGHGKVTPNVVVDEADITRMLDLGYENDAAYPDRGDIFVLTGKPLPVRSGNPYYQAWQEKLRDDPSNES